MRDGGSSLGSGSSRRTVVRDVCGDAGRGVLSELFVPPGHLHVCDRSQVRAGGPRRTQNIGTVRTSPTVQGHGDHA